MPTSNDETGAVKLHDLFSREIRPDSNWYELMQSWQSAKTPGDILGVLHRGFGTPLGREQWGEKGYDEIDRLTFYLEKADGWADLSVLERYPNDRDKRYYFGYDSFGNQIWKSPGEIRQMLAQKAFDMLCLNFFKVELKRGGRDDDLFNRVWMETVVSGQLFLVLQNFFRVEENRSIFGDSGAGRVRNLSFGDNKLSHNEQLAVTFLLNLAEFLWRWKEPDISRWYAANEDEKEKHIAHVVATRTRIEAAKPWMIEVLVALNRLKVLRKWILELNEACLTKLKEIAMRSKLSKYSYLVAKDRPVATIDEACFVGSKAVWFLKEHELQTREHRRLKAIREAERKKTEADQEIEKLTAEK